LIKFGRSFFGRAIGNQSRAFGQWRRHNGYFQACNGALSISWGRFAEASEWAAKALLKSEPFAQTEGCGIFLAPGCSSKSEGNKSNLLAEGLEFFHRILVYLYVDVHPYMESRPRQIRAQAGRLSLTNPRRGENSNGFFPLPVSGRESSRAGLRWILSRLPCPEVIEERNRMAREIHDTLAQQFAGIFLHLEAANNLLNAQQQHLSEYVTRAKELAKCGLEDARRMLLGLRPKSLDGSQLCDALKQLAENFCGDCGIDCSFCLRGRTCKLPETAEDELYRVAQEALCNVRKHSRARAVSILLRYRPGGVLLAIKDNGHGFVVKKPQAGAQGFGLPAMSERALRLGGKLEINSRAGAGTELKMTVPVPRRISTETNNQRISETEINACPPSGENPDFDRA